MFIKKEDLIIQRPNPSLNVNKRQVEYDRRYIQYRKDLDRFHVEIEMIMRLLEVRKGQRIINIGGGVGFTLYEVAGFGTECFNVDICPGDPKFVHEMAKHYGLDIKSMQGDSCALPFGDETFDSIYSKDVFEHIWDFEKGMNEQIRVLKKGGHLLILVGNLINPKTFYRMFVKRFIETRGKAGGLRWLLTKHKAVFDFGIGWHGKDEDFKTTFWWKRKMRQFPELQTLLITTTRAHARPDRLINRIFRPFIGGIIILAKKKEQ
ncbi:MAG: class I SAM-dependent methyltransferase [Candidatus Krumholzibacteriota bacterium]|nr:class I SAM-dependent methyltransferase [Candidatus Krumholzibacteriota bacterium]